MTWSAQVGVDEGAAWDDPPEWWAGEITVGASRRNGTHRKGTTIMNTNGEHWTMGLMVAGVGALVMLGAAAGSIGLSGSPGFSPPGRDDQHPPR